MGVIINKYKKKINSYTCQRTYYKYVKCKNLTHQQRSEPVALQQLSTTLATVCTLSMPVRKVHCGQYGGAQTERHSPE